MKRSGRLARVKVTADGEGVVSHAGAELLRELAGHTGLINAWDAALIGTYKAMPIHFPGSVLADLAVAIADGADSISDLKALRDEPDLFGPSPPHRLLGGYSTGCVERIFLDFVRDEPRPAPQHGRQAPDPISRVSSIWTSTRRS